MSTSTLERAPQIFQPEYYQRLHDIEVPAFDSDQNCRAFIFAGTVDVHARSHTFAHSVEIAFVGCFEKCGVGFSDGFAGLFHGDWRIKPFLFQEASSTNTEKPNDTRP